MDDRGERQHRLDRARRLAWVELAVAIGAPLFAGFMYVAAPGFMGGPPPTLMTTLIPLAGILGIIVGIVWMIRIHRTGPEAGERTWRYRDF